MFKTAGGYNKIFKCPLPRNQKEFAILSKYVFGKPLSVSWDGFRYEIREPFDSYYSARRDASVFGPRVGPYYLNEVFCRTVFGPLSCGGIAGHAYGSVSQKGMGWRAKKRGREFASGKAALSGVRPAFARLASQCRVKRKQG